MALYIAHTQLIKRCERVSAEDVGIITFYYHPLITADLLRLFDHILQNGLTKHMQKGIPVNLDDRGSQPRETRGAGIANPEIVNREADLLIPIILQFAAEPFDLRRCP